MLSPPADSSDFAAMKAYWEEGDLSDEPAATVAVRFADLPTSEAPVILNFDAAVTMPKRTASARNHCGQTTLTSSYAKPLNSRCP